MHNHSIDYLLLLLLALIWSASFLLIKIGVQHIPPFTLTALRMVIAAAALGVCLGFKKTRLPLHPRALLLYTMVGLLGNTIPFTLINWGELYIDSSLAAIMIGSMPITTFILAHYFLPSDSLGVRSVIGLGLGILGLATLFGWSAFSDIGGAHVWGQGAVFLAATSYAVITVFVRTQPKFGGIEMATGAILFGALFSVPLAFWQENPLALDFHATSLYAAIGLGLFPTAMATILYFHLLHRLGVVTFSQLNYMVPVFGSFWGVLVLGETLHLRTLIALALVLAGIYFTRPKP